MGQPLPGPDAAPSPEHSTGYTERQYELLTKCKAVIPKSFLREADDPKILAYIQLVVDDVNYVPPLTDYLVENIPPFFDTIIVLGANAYTLLFQMQKWSLEDFTYTNNGLTVTLDRVAKIKSPYDEFFKLYMDKTKGVKRNRMSKMVLATPRNQHMLGQFLKITLGEGFSWR